MRKIRVAANWCKRRLEQGRGEFQYTNHHITPLQSCLGDLGSSHIVVSQTYVMQCVAVVFVLRNDVKITSKSTNIYFITADQKNRMLINIALDFIILITLSTKLFLIVHVFQLRYFKTFE